MGQRSKVTTVVVAILLVAGLAELVSRLVTVLDDPSVASALALFAAIGVLVAGLVWVLRPGAAPRPTPGPLRQPSPSTPAGPTGDPGSAPPWATASTPWPRAQEDDPDGTLIRPPRR